MITRSLIAAVAIGLGACGVAEAGVQVRPAAPVNPRYQRPILVQPSGPNFGPMAPANSGPIAPANSGPIGPANGGPNGGPNGMRPGEGGGPDANTVVIETNNGASSIVIQDFRSQGGPLVIRIVDQGAKPNGPNSNR